MTTGLRRSRSSSLIRSSLTASVVAALLTSTPGAAGAAASAAAPQNPQRQLAALQYRMEQATESYNVARVELLASQAKAEALYHQMALQDQRVQALQADVDIIAAAAYKGGNLNAFNAVFSSDGPQALLDQLSTLQHLSKEQRAQLYALAQAQRKLATQRTTVGKELTVQTKREATLRSQKQAIEADLNRAKKLAVAAATVSERASRSHSRSRTATYFGPPVAGSGRGAIALRFAYAQMGKPYGWGSSGPGSYDCSGLTMRAWAAAGVSLPHSSRMQYGSSPHVSRSQLRPGDLVFFYSPISHVAIYVGGNTAIGAPHEGDVVRYQSISTMDYAGATRPG